MIGDYFDLTFCTNSKYGDCGSSALLGITLPFIKLLPIAPGSTNITLISKGSSSYAIDSLKPSRANLVATCAEITGNGTCPFTELMKNSSSADLVAKVVLDAVRNENPNLRYLAGNDVEQWLGSKRNMSDEEFYKIMKQNLMM